MSSVVVTATHSAGSDQIVGAQSRATFSMHYTSFWYYTLQGVFKAVQLPTVSLLSHFPTILPVRHVIVMAHVYFQSLLFDRCSISVPVVFISSLYWLFLCLVSALSVALAESGLFVYTRCSLVYDVRWYMMFVCI